MSILDEIQKGENRRLEFKESVPDSLKIMKTAAAFSNGAGGKLIIGVKDKTNEVIGISKDDIMDLPDRITNIIFDGCYPNIIPEIYTENIEGRNVLVVEFYPGNLKPYYIKSYGKLKGTYIRVGATNKPADEEMITELERQRRNISFDEEIMHDVDHTTLDISALKEGLSKLMDRNIGDSELLTLKLLKEDTGKIYPTRGLFILNGSSNNFEFVRIKCARFKGEDIEEFIDQKEFRGPLYEQVDNAIGFAKTHISKRGIIKDIKREDQYAIPITAIREAIVNAVVHRDYSISGSDIKFAIFDNRVEITSPGLLPKTLSIDDIKSGKSEIRNKVIARVFSEIKYIEQWGTGIRRIISECRKSNLKEPLFEETGMFFKVTIYNSEVEEVPIYADKTAIDFDGLSDDEMKIVEFIREKGYINNKLCRDNLGFNKDKAVRVLNSLIKKQVLQKIGSGNQVRYILKG